MLGLFMETVLFHGCDLQYFSEDRELLFGDDCEMKGYLVYSLALSELILYRLYSADVEVKPTHNCRVIRTSRESTEQRR